MTTKKQKKIPLDEFKIAIQKHLKPPRYKHFNTGSKLGCALMTRIRVGRSYLNAHSYSIGLAPENTCKCNDRDQETPLHFITTCTIFTDHRSILFTQIEQFIPNFKKLAKKRQYEILMYGYEIDNVELTKINRKILLATQNYIFKTKRFLEHPL